MFIIVNSMHTQFKSWFGMSQITCESTKNVVIRLILSAYPCKTAVLDVLELENNAAIGSPDRVSLLSKDDRPSTDIQVHFKLLLYKLLHISNLQEMNGIMPPV